MYDTLWDHHLWISNWPLKCLVPAEVQDPIIKSKGITDLHRHEQVELAIVLGIIGATEFPLTIHKATASELKGRFLINLLIMHNYLTLSLAIENGKKAILSTRPLNPTSTNPSIRHVYFKGKRATPKFMWEGEDDAEGGKEIDFEDVEEEDDDEQESPPPMSTEGRHQSDKDSIALHQ